MNLEQIAEFLENPNLLENLPPSEDRALKLNGLFYFFEYQVPDEESLAFTQFFLTENPDSVYKNYFINFILHKNSVGNKEANQLLFDFLFSHPDPDLVTTILEHNITPISKTHGTLFALYQNNRNGFMQIEEHLEILTTYFINASPEVRNFLIQKAETNRLNNWVILAKAVYYDTNAGYHNLLINFEKFSPKEITLTVNFLSYFVKTHPGVVKLLFKLFNTYQTKTILNLINESKLQSQDPEEHALFLLFTNQWDNYDSFDFDNTYLKNAFLKASPNQRQKILAQSRKTGKFNWLHDMSNEKQTKWVSDLNETDWENILTRLINEKNEKILLRILKIVPPIQAKIIIQTIQNSPENRFEFTGDDDWLELVSVVQRLPDKLPQPQEIKFMRTLANPVLSSEIESGSKEILLGTPSNQIHKVTLDSLKPTLPAYDSPAPQIRQMLLSQDRNYLVLAHGDHQIRVLRLADQQVIKTFTGHVGYIKKLILSEDQKTLFSTGFDGKLIAWRFPLGPMIHSCQISTQECFDMQLLAGQKSGIIGSAEGTIHVFDAATLQIVRKFQASESAITSLAASVKTPQIAIYDKSETLSVWNIESGVKIASSEITETPITTMAYSDHDDFVITGHLSGAQTFYSTATARPITSLTVHSQPVINFHKLKNHRILIVFRDGFLSLVDYSVLNSLYTPINLLKAEINFSTPSSSWGNFVNTFYRFIHRFDILIDTEQAIQIGDYDIQIELED